MFCGPIRTARHILMYSHPLPASLPLMQMLGTQAWDLLSSLLKIASPWSRAFLVPDVWLSWECCHSAIIPAWWPAELSLTFVFLKSRLQTELSGCSSVTKSWSSSMPQSLSLVIWHYKTNNRAMLIILSGWGMKDRSVRRASHVEQELLFSL